MKIKSLKLYKSEDLIMTEGLEMIDLHRIPNVVALVGRNGSGKTRVLNTIEKLIQNISYEEMDQYLDLSFTGNYGTNIDRTISSNLLHILSKRSSRFTRLKKTENAEYLSDLNSSLLNLERELRLEQSQINNRQRSGQNLLVSQQFLQKEDADRKNINKFFHRIKHSDITALIPIESRNNSNKIVDFETLLERVADNVDYDEMNALYQYGMKFLIELPAKLKFDLVDTNNDDAKFKNRSSSKRFVKLKKIFEQFIGKPLEWESKLSESTPNGSKLNITYEGIWKVDGREFDYNEFSDGEKSLFGYVLLFFLLDVNPNVRLSESVILIDEPELHLHPESEIDLINGIRKLVSDKGQLWIATHSLNILSHLNQEEIFMVKKGRIYKPSESTPENSLNELMGLEDKVFKLSEFVSSISEWSYTNFMVQCFNEPDVIAHSNEGDPQVELFKESILSTKSKTLLDFGAGKGRLFERLKYDEKFGSVNYSALEPNSDLHLALKDLGANQIFTQYKDLPVNAFDHIVLCNVLHEISISEWVPTLNKVLSALKETGFLVIIEDRLLPKGEKIDVVGFLLMDIPELTELFGLKSEVLELKTKEEHYSERIMCAVLPKQNMVKQINKKNLLNAIEKLQKRVLSDLKILRESSNMNDKSKASVGRRSALYSQLYCNACLAQKEIESWD